MDQGYGIAWTDQAKLFQRFQRFIGVNQPKTDGVGLGLVFVKSVLDRHQAPISFVSKPNEGTTFTISIPAYYES
jgi:K+-sensing histidine kinase KdpD